MASAACAMVHIFAYLAARSLRLTLLLLLITLLPVLKEHDIESEQDPQEREENRHELGPWPWNPADIICCPYQGKSQEEKSDEVKKYPFYFRPLTGYWSNTRLRGP